MDRTDQSGKKSMILAVVALLCATAVLIFAFSMVNRMRESYVRYTPDQITQQVIGEMKLNDLTKVGGDQLSKHYDIPDGVISESSVYMCKSTESAAELACFLLTDPSKYDALQDAVTAHINTKAAGFKTLNPTQYNELKNYQISRSGRYVLVAVGNNAEAEEKYFQSLLG